MTLIKAELHFNLEKTIKAFFYKQTIDLYKFTVVPNQYQKVFHNLKGEKNCTEHYPPKESGQ